eukprot:5953813-Pleurochrysis_carterae.AAC.2
MELMLRNARRNWFTAPSYNDDISNGSLGGAKPEAEAETACCAVRRGSSIGAWVAALVQGVSGTSLSIYRM